MVYATCRAGTGSRKNWMTMASLQYAFSMGRLRIVPKHMRHAQNFSITNDTKLMNMIKTQRLSDNVNYTDLQLHEDPWKTISSKGWINWKLLQNLSNGSIWMENILLQNVFAMLRSHRKAELQLCFNSKFFHWLATKILYHLSRCYNFSGLFLLFTCINLMLHEVVLWHLFLFWPCIYHVLNMLEPHVYTCIYHMAYTYI